MKRMLIVLLLALLLLPGCAGQSAESGSSSDNMDAALPESTESEISSDNMDAALPESTVERLAAFPEGYRDMIKQTDLVVEDHGEILNESLWETFCADVEAGTEAEVVLARFTTEGDPILYDVLYDGAESFLLVTDTSRDAFDADAGYQSENYRYFQKLTDGDTEWWILSDTEYKDYAAYSSDCESDPEKAPAAVLVKYQLNSGD